MEAFPSQRVSLLWPTLTLASTPLRTIAVLAFAATSVALIWYPVEFRLEYTPIQSLDAIPMLSLFALLLVGWLGLLFALLWSTDKLWPTLGLVVVFGLVYFSFWTLRWPDGFRESWIKMQGVQVITSTGQLAPLGFHYSEWPGIATLGTVVSFVAGEDIASLNIPVVLAVQIALPICLFALYLRLLGSTRAAALAVVLAIMANAYLARFHFHPFWFGSLLLIVGYVILLRHIRLPKPNTSDTVLLFVVAGGITVFHFYTGVLLFTSVAGMFVVQRWRWARLPTIGVTPRTVMTITLLPAFWQLYWSSRISDNIVRHIPELLSNVLAREFNELFFYAGGVAAKNVAGIPLWANVTRLGWLAGLYGGGVVLAVWVIWRRDNWAPQLRIASIWLLVIAVTGAVAVMLFGGGGEFRRFLMYGSPLAAPVVIACSYSVGRNIALAGVAGLLLVLTVPTFLVNANVVSTESHYSEQRMAGEFLAHLTDAKDPGKGVVLYNIGAGSIGRYHLPYASIESGLGLDRNRANPRESVRETYQRMIETYGASDGETGLHLMWTDASRLAGYTAWFGPDDAAYVLEPVSTTVPQSTRLYDNGMVELWTPD